ncbi:MAG: hypothetical protein JRG76_07255 [Deltaproteobacteria bacterium]|nr:hypothetical protein [Deltaproteobacteria bacterium]MBW2414291.1 hypothetical protein [Deltaproteobacteria bacterium]
MRSWIWIAPGLAVALALVACADTPEKVRTVTYPPDFHYITRDEIDSVMGRLAVQMVRLEARMQRDGEFRDEDRDAVVQILSEMLRLSQELKQGTRSSHPRIHREGPRLERDIERALRAARLDPPNYYFAGEVSGACEYCHTPRHEPRRPPRVPEVPPPGPGPGPGTGGS